jgi:glutathione S-transferase
LLLYNNQASGNCYKVRLLLHQLGIPFETVELDVIDRSNRPEVLGDKNPAQRVPTLQLDDGTYLAESNAIIWYLGEGTQYVPEDRLERARALQWMFFEQYDLEPNIAVARFWVSILKKYDADQLAAKQKNGYKTLDGMERHLHGRPFLVGDSYTVADISLYAYTHVADEGGLELDRYPAIRAWLERVASQPGHVTIDA